MCDVIDKALSKDYREGFPSAVYFIQALKGAMSKSGLTTMKQQVGRVLQGQQAKNRAVDGPHP